METYQFINLQIIPLSLMIGFLWFEKKEYDIIHRLNSFVSKSQRLTDVDLKILTDYFVYYKKLSPHLKYIFEEKVADLSFSLKFETSDKSKLNRKVQILIAAYAAQLTFCINDFDFVFTKNIILHARLFKNQNGDFVIWDIDSKGIIHISLRHFYRDIKTAKSEFPIGLQIMSKAVSIENFLFSNSKDLKNRNSISLFGYQAYQRMALNHTSYKLFNHSDMESKEKFLQSCILFFYCKPFEFRNEFPDLFKEMDKLLFSKAIS